MARADAVPLPPQGAFVIVDKPVGPTSHDIVMRARRVFRTREIGHTGTLDPFASGVMVLVLGQATRCADLLGRGRKRYLAHARLGVVTDTDDGTGTVVEEHAVPGFDDAALRGALEALTGDIMQVPPAYSAKHVDGRRAYDLARSGQVVSLPAVPVTVHALACVSRGPSQLVLDVECGPGTYIRSIARDLGRALGCGAHLSQLRRTRVGAFTDADAVPVDALEPASLRPVRDMLSHVPHAFLDDRHASEVALGRAVTRGTVGPLPWRAGDAGLVATGTRLVALGMATRDLPEGTELTAGDVDVGRRFPVEAGQ